MAEFRLSPLPVDAGIKEMRDYLNRQYDFLSWILQNLDEQNMTKDFLKKLKK